MTRLNKLKVYFIFLALLASIPARVLGFEVYYYETDAFGTPIMMENTAGKRVWRAVYCPFGEERGLQEIPESNDRRFLGKEKDKETGLNYFEVQYMEANTGRFLSPDPVGPVDAFSGETNYVLLTQPQRLNRYAYGLNNPYRYVDRDGKIPLDTIWDALNVAYDVYTGNRVALAADLASLATPYVPAGLTKLGSIGIVAGAVGDSLKASKQAKVYHYTDEAGAKAIEKSGVIKPDSKGRVFVTKDKVSAADANNTLFMGRGGTKGTHRVEIDLKNSVKLERGTQPNELIHNGAIRDPRQGTLEVKDNDF